MVKTVLLIILYIFFNFTYDKKKEGRLQWSY